MAEILSKYQNGKIYKIISYAHPDEVYYGSTVEALSKRMAHHIWNATSQKKYVCSSKQVLQYDDAKILLVENYPCNSREELNKREGEYILNNKCVNKIVAGQTEKEYRLVHKEERKEKRKVYEKNNAETIKIRRQHYSKQYLEQNRTEIHQRRNKEELCKCGETYSYANKRRHEASQIHIKKLANK